MKNRLGTQVNNSRKTLSFALITLVFSIIMATIISPFFSHKAYANTPQIYGLRSGMVSYWPLDGNIRDYSDNANHAVSSGTFSYGEALTGTSSARFDGEGIISSNKNKVTLGSNDFTVSLWMTGGESGWHYIYRAQSDMFLAIGFNLSGPTGNVEVWSKTDVDNVFANSIDTYGLSDWKHVVVTRDSNLLSVYVNGVFQNSGTINGNINFGGPGESHIGQDPGYPSITGNVDEVAIWNRPLTVTEIGDLYNSGDGLSLKILPSLEGSGSQADPFIIRTCQQLQDMNYELAAYYELGEDIDCSATVGWNAGLGFMPIGTAGPDNYVAGPPTAELDNDPFTGSFDGKGFEISDLYINRTTKGNVGLFGYVYDSAGVGKSLKNVTISNATINCDARGGILAGYTRGITGSPYMVSDVTVSGSLTGINAIVGGVVGEGNFSAYDNLRSDVDISGEFNVAGGLVGHVQTGFTISNSTATGSISILESYAGGAIGQTSNYSSVLTEIDNVVSYVEVSSSQYSGGIIGLAAAYGNNVVISNSHAYGDVFVTNGIAGGFMAYGANNGKEVIVTDSTANGNVTSTNGGMLGGFVGRIDNGSSGSTFARCVARGDVYSEDSDAFGGFIAYGLVTIYDSYAYGNVSGPGEDLGGFAGRLHTNSSVRRVYSYGDVNGNWNVAGLAGSLGGTTIVEDSFALGTIVGNSNVAGLVGSSDNTVSISRSYWFDDGANPDIAVGAGSPTQVDNGSVTDKEYFKDSDNIPLSNWDFDGVWALRSEINDGFPYLGTEYNYYTLDVSIVGDGSVTIEPLQDDYLEGSVVTLTPVNNTGWGFYGWSGDLTTNVRPLVLEMDSDKSLTATFQINKYQILNIPTGLDLSVEEEGYNLSAGIFYGELVTVVIRDQATGLIYGKVQIQFLDDVDFATVSAGIDMTAGKSFIHGLGRTFSLFIVKLPEHEQVGVCPGADSLEVLNSDCAGFYVLTMANPELNGTTLSVVNEGGIDYWVVSGLAGSGGYGFTPLANTGDDLWQVLMVMMMVVFASTSVVIAKSYKW